LSREAIKNWTTQAKTGQPEASNISSDLAIETMASVQAIFSLPGRQSQGFLQSNFDLLKLDLTAPDHSTLSPHRGTLDLKLPLKQTGRTRHLVVASTGVKV
jgi:hypothetical protein